MRVHTLRTVHRQQDAEFVGVLHRMRLSTHTKEDIIMLRC